MKIAIVHEMLIKLGGAEKVLEALLEMYPDADVFTLMYDHERVGNVFLKEKIRCIGPAQWFYRFTKKPRWSLPLMPLSVRMIDLSGYDLVISSSSGFAHGVRTGEKTIHVCYCHSPARYLWDWTKEIQIEIGTSSRKGKEKSLEKRNFFKLYFLGPIVRLLFWWLRKVDLQASKRPMLYIANSGEVQKRIQKYYHRDSVVLWPPIETDHFRVGETPVSKRNYYIVTSALTPFKRVDIPVRVLSKLNIPLKIIGSGTQMDELKKLAGPTVGFLGRISDDEMTQVYTEARAFLMPQKEDAGMAPLEAMAAGLPVFGQGAGGLLETNIDGVTGRFFPVESDESFQEKFLQFHDEIQAGKYDDPAPIVEQAEKFRKEIFENGFREILKNR